MEPSSARCGKTPSFRFILKLPDPRNPVTPTTIRPENTAKGSSGRLTTRTAGSAGEP